MNYKREIPQDAGKPEGRYANYFKVGHNAFEFILDAGQFYPEGKEAQLHTRIVTSPVYAKALLKILQGAVNRYEQVLGNIAGDDE